MNKIVTELKNNKNMKYSIYFFVLVTFIFTIGYSLSMFTSNQNNKVANIKVNDLSFNITTNNGDSDERILHLQAGKTETFNIVITNLNNISTKYELIYDVCNNVDCNETSKNLPDNIIISYQEEKSDAINGTIDSGSNNTKIINILTQNSTENDIYIKLNLNAGYTWNNLDLADQFVRKPMNQIDTETQIIAYVDGVETSEFPKSCNYVSKIRGYKDGNEVVLGDSALTCDRDKNVWKLTLEGLVSKVVLNFTYMPGVPPFTYTGKYEVLNKDTSDWKIKFLTSGTLVFTGETPMIDVFLVGGGGGGAGQHGQQIACGGGGGYTKTEKSVIPIVGEKYPIVIGAGGSGGGSSTGGGNGGASSAFSVTVAGGKGATYGGAGYGGAGGSGGGGATWSSSSGYSYGAGGSDGSNGGGGRGGSGQGTTTREFGEPDGTLYAGGGGAYANSASGGSGGGGNGNASGTGGSGATNTGGGGGGGGRSATGDYTNPTNYHSGGKGGSGIVIIRATKNV